jgi:single-stranded-DNA-specific exonuclease
VAASPARTAFTIQPCSYREVRELSAELGVSEPIAMMLVRRGYRTATAARAFIDASETHDPFDFAAMEEVVEGLLAAAGAGLRITVHGDYDVDGVCSTAILVAALREVGADCDWYIPDRMGDGYGLSAATVRRLADRGTRLLLTADCGIGCADEVALARELGVEVIVTDHHEPGERLPDCPILHPRVSGYPFEELCATGVAHKLASALRERAGIDAADGRSDLDLVALATVADLVPLRGENRALVREGLAEARRGGRLGLRALVAAAGCEIERLDEGDCAFRLAPRINAAGRLYRADAGVELMLTSDADRAEAIAEELNRANSERRFAEREALAGAQSALTALPDEVREAPAVVIAGEGWHPGVVGIVASRMVELHWRPAIVIGLGEDGRGRGSGRSIPGFDLLAGLEACGGLLERFGGHRAAAGLEIRAENVEAFRAAFAEHAASVLEPADLVRSQAVDAIVGGESLGLPTAEELELLAPFGKGNPEPRLLVPAARVQDVRPMGEEGRHARFSLQSGARRALGVAFGVNGALDRAAAGGPLDVAVKLELNHWNGSVEPRVVLSELYEHAPVAGDAPSANGEPACSTAAEPAEWWRGFDAEMEADLAAPPPRPAGPSARAVVDRLGDSPVACIAGLLSTGASVLAICADVARRRGLAESAADPSRFGGGEAVLACGRCAVDPMAARLGALTASGRGLALADWGALELAPDLAEPFEHVVVVDPPPFPELESLAGRGEGYLHLAWGRPELELALRVHDAQWPLRPVLAAGFRALREAGSDAGGQVAGEELVLALAGGARRPHSGRIAARNARVLTELGLVEWDRTGTTPGLGVVSSVAKDLERSGSFRAYRARHEEGKRFLNSKKQR